MEIGTIIQLKKDLQEGDCFGSVEVNDVLEKHRGEIGQILAIDESRCFIVAFSGVVRVVHEQMVEFVCDDTPRIHEIHPGQYATLSKILPEDTLKYLDAKSSVYPDNPILAGNVVRLVDDWESIYKERDDLILTSAPEFFEVGVVLWHDLDNHLFVVTPPGKAGFVSRELVELTGEKKDLKDLKMDPLNEQQQFCLRMAGIPSTPEELGVKER